MKAIIFSVVLLTLLVNLSSYGQAFVHPGILNNQSELDFVKSKIQAGQQPWLQAFNDLKASSYSSLTYVAKPYATVSCGSFNNPNIGCSQIVDDGMAAYSLALMWEYTGDIRYATKSISIINAWSTTFQNITTQSNQRLVVSWAVPWYTNAAEILRYSNCGWTNTNLTNFNAFLAKLLPYVTDDTMPGNNWIQSSIEAHLAISIFTDNRTEFNSAISRWKVRVKTYIYQTTDGATPFDYPSGHVNINSSRWNGTRVFVNGLCMETCRDLGHMKLGVNSMMYAAQSAYEQGVDLFTLEQKRLSDFFELHGSWMTGAAAVPLNINGGLVIVSPGTPGIKPPTGGGGAAFEIAYNHLHTRLNTNLPYTLQMINTHRPANAGHWVFKWETLTHGDLPFNINPTTNNPPTISIASPQSTTTNCSPASITMNASATDDHGVQKVEFYNGATLLNTDNSSPFTYTWNPVSTGSYSITAKAYDASNLNTTSNSIKIDVYLTPTIVNKVSLNGTWLTANQAVACAGATIILGPSPVVATGWRWTGLNGFTSTQRDPTLISAAINQTGTYTAKYLDLNGCSAISSFNLQINAVPTATVTSPTNSFCAGGSVVLTSSTGASYKWFNGTTQVGIAATYTATTAGNYTVQVTNASGCSATSAVKKITINPLPTATITSPSNSFCAGGSVVLTSSAGASYKWFSGTTLVGTTATYTANTAGNYTAQVTNTSGCSTTSAVKTITISALPTATITSPSNSFCAGSSVVLTSSACASYKWFNTTTQVGTTATYTATAAGNYTVQVTNASGCSATSAVKTITISALPNATITSPSNSFCAGGSVVLTSSAGASYKWFSGTTLVGTAASYTATTAGNYTVQVTNASGCSATSAVKTITISALPTATITSPSNSFCEGGSIVLTSSTGASYKWFNGTTLVGTAASYTATTARNYTVQVTNASGCSTTSAVKTITISALPTATITSPSNSFCAGGSVVLTSSAGASYKWFNGTTQVGTAAIYTATAAGNYMVEVTNNAGCNATSAPSVISVTNSIIWYADTDGDGKGDPAVTQNSCTQPTGYVSVAGDGCPTDSNKIAPGICGCNVPESSCTKQPQTITFTPFNPNQHVGDPDFNLSASASSGLPITYTSSNPNVAIIIGNTVHIVGPGSTTITASQGGNSTYAPSSTTQTLNIAGAVSQAILQVLDGSTILQDNGAALNIGSAPINTQTLNKTITLKNIGTNDLIIKSLSAIPGFRVTQQNATSTIQPNQTISILITGIPTDINAPTIGAIHIASNDPNATFTLNVSVDVSTSTSTLGSLLSSQIELFPNPTTGNVSLRFNGSFEEVSIQLFSIDGKFIERKDIGMVANIEEQLLIQELPNGVYFLEIKTKQGSIVKRLIKQ
jgi:PKD repeat protein